MLSFSSKQRLVLLLGVVSWASASPVICGTQSDCSGQTGKDCCGISNYCVSPDYSQSVSCEVVACTRTLDCIGLNSRSTCCNTNQGSYCSTAAYCSNQNGGGGVGGANEPPTPPTTPAGEECTLAEEEIDAGLKSRTAFLITFFLLPWGGGRWYYGYNWVGFFQCALGVITCYGQCAIRILAQGREEHSQQFMMCACCLCVCAIALFAWWVADLALIATYKLLPQEYCLVKDL